MASSLLLSALPRSRKIYNFGVDLSAWLWYYIIVKPKARLSAMTSPPYIHYQSVAVCFSLWYFSSASLCTLPI